MEAFQVTPNLCRMFQNPASEMFPEAPRGNKSVRIFSTATEVYKFSFQRKTQVVS